MKSFELILRAIIPAASIAFSCAGKPVLAQSHQPRFCPGAEYSIVVKDSLIKSPFALKVKANEVVISLLEKDDPGADRFWYNSSEGSWYKNGSKNEPVKLARRSAAYSRRAEGYAIAVEAAPEKTNRTVLENPESLYIYPYSEATYSRDLPWEKRPIPLLRLRRIDSSASAGGMSGYLVDFFDHAGLVVVSNAAVVESSDLQVKSYAGASAVFDRDQAILNVPKSGPTKCPDATGYFNVGNPILTLLAEKGFKLSGASFNLNSLIQLSQVSKDQITYDVEVLSWAKHKENVLLMGEIPEFHSRANFATVDALPELRGINRLLFSPSRAPFIVIGSGKRQVRELSQRSSVECLGALIQNVLFPLVDASSGDGHALKDLLRVRPLLLRLEERFENDFTIAQDAGGQSWIKHLSPTYGNDEESALLNDEPHAFSCVGKIARALSGRFTSKQMRKMGSTTGLDAFSLRGN